MNQFVNYGTRDVSLPTGCKNLIDVLNPKPFTLKKERAEKEGLKRVEALVPLFLAAPRERSFTVFPSPGQLACLFLSSQGNPSVLLPVENEECEQSVRRILAEAGISPSMDGFQESPRIPILRFALPTEAGDATRLVTRILREAFQVSEEAGLEFLIDEH